MKFVAAIGIGIGIIFFVFILIGICSKPRVSAGAVVKFEEPRIPWLFIGVLRIIRVVVGFFVVFVGLITVKMLMIGYSEISDVSSTLSGWAICINLVIILFPIILFCRFAGKLRNKINALYRSGGGSSDLLIVRRWHF